MNRFKVMFPELNENQRKMLSTLIQGAIPEKLAVPNSVDGMDMAKVLQQAAGTCYNQAINEIRNNLKELGIL